jgi:hypothetical protein
MKIMMPMTHGLAKTILQTMARILANRGVDSFPPLFEETHTRKKNNQNPAAKPQPPPTKKQ